MVQTKLKIDTHKQVVTRLIVLALITCTLAALSYKLFHPGLQYDETLFINGSLGFKFEWMKKGSLFGIPTFVFPYIGSVKSILYSPLFHIFGINAYTIRLPSLMIGLIAIYSPLLCLKSKLSKYNIFIYFAVTGSCTTLLFLTRNDWGPVAISLLLTSILYIIVFLYNTPLKSNKDIALISSLSFLLVFNKLDGIFPIISITLVYITSNFLHSRLTQRSKSDSNYLIAIKRFLFSISPAYIFFAIRVINIKNTVGKLSSDRSVKPFGDYLQESVSSTLDPYRLTGYFYDNPGEFHVFHKITLILLACITIALIFAHKSQFVGIAEKNINLGSVSKKLFANSIILTLLIYLAPLQTSIHHYYMIGFSILLSLSFGLIHANEFLACSNSLLNKLLRLAILLLLTINATFNIIGTSFSLKNIHHGSYSEIWNNEIYALSSTMGKMVEKNNNYVSALYIGWGFINQIESLNAFKIDLNKYYSREIWDSPDNTLIQNINYLFQKQTNKLQKKLNHYIIFIGKNKSLGMESLDEQHNDCIMSYAKQLKKINGNIKPKLEAKSSLIMKYSHVCTFLMESKNK